MTTQGKEPAIASAALPPPCIQVNGKWLARPITGTGRYAQEVVRELTAADAVDLLLHVPSDAQVPRWLEERCSIIWHRSTGAAFEQLSLPLATRGKLLLNLAGPAPLLKRRQLVVMHDATPMRWPLSYSRAFRWWYRIMYTWLSRWAQYLVTVSEFSRMELATVLRVSAERFVIGACGHEHFKSLNPSRPQLPEGFDANKPFLVCVGTLAQHKNLVDPAEALARAGWQVLVVGTGGPSRVFASGVYEQLPPGLALLGRISDEELAWCYDNAVALVFPSLYEGFGLPVIEAQSRGCPVVASDTASLPEVLGSSGLLFPPRDQDQLLQHVASLREDTERRTAIVAAGHGNIKRFSWNHTAAVMTSMITAAR